MYMPAMRSPPMCGESGCGRMQHLFVALHRWWVMGGQVATLLGQCGW